MSLRIERCPKNPIVRPGGPAWRRAAVFNPAVLYDDGRFFLYERAAGGLRPFHNSLGLHTSADGVQFELAHPEPVVTPALLGSPYGSVQDPRIVKLEGVCTMTFAYRPYAWSLSPTGVGVPESWQTSYPGFSGKDEENQTRSGILVSHDRVHWTLRAWVSGPEIDDRNVILFPERIGGRFAVLRRPSPRVTTLAQHRAPPLIQISFSEDLEHWSAPQPVLRPAFAWESNRIGGSTPPIRTEAGWLVLYHGVETLDEPSRAVCYRLGAAMLDERDPTRVLARCPQWIMEPEAYCERHGLVIPNTIFPTSAVVKDGLVYLYYGCCDTAIGLATVPLAELVAHVMHHRVPR